MGPLAFGELVPTGAEDVERLAEKRGVEEPLLDLGKAIEDGIPAIPSEGTRGTGSLPLG